MSSVTSVVWPTPRSHCQHSEGPAAEGRAEADPVEGGNAPPDGGRGQETPPAPAPSALLPRLAACLTSVIGAGGFFEAHVKAWRQPRPGSPRRAVGAQVAPSLGALRTGVRPGVELGARASARSPHGVAGTPRCSIQSPRSCLATSLLGVSSFSAPQRPLLTQPSGF